MEFNTWQRVMIYLVGEPDPICGDRRKEAIKWVAKKLHRAESTTYGYYEGRGEPSISDARNLHESLVEKYDCHAVMSYLNHEFNVDGGVANGTPKDDFWEIHELSTDGARFFKKAKNGCAVSKQKYFDVVQEIKKEVKDLEAEGNRLEA